ncbi:FkbM family methyltransferase [Marinicella meishanensis]|uniref:FkbM family methyltransferase n=1 Tax=Marinicella meishanensis TaxID=2873263 RepID=UPI001CBF735C|nr:FkbM family methyltransferase [Marinicella sp. NBU2979]
MKPFGTHQPSAAISRQVDWCQRLPANWLGKITAACLRSRVLRQTDTALDLTLGEMRLRCHLHDSQAERSVVFFPAGWHQQERQWLLNALPAEGVFIDIGAHVGIHAALAATVLNRLGTVMAIEPHPAAFERMQFNLAATREGLQEKPRIETVAAAVSDESGPGQLFLHPADLSLASLLSTPSAESHIPVAVEPLLSLVKSQNLSRVDVIKCHSNGTEDRVLVPYLLDAPHHLLPHGFIINHQAESWTLDLLAMLQQRDYHITAQTSQSLLAQLRQPIAYQAKAKKYKQAIPAIG